MAETKRPRKPAPRVSAVFARRLREARNARGWTQQELSDELRKLSAPMHHTTLAKIEKGKQQVRLDELVAIATALDVAIVHLIFPIEGDATYKVVDTTEGTIATSRLGPRVALTPAVEVNQVKARRWARGAIPLRPASLRFYRDQTAGDLAVSAEELPTAEQEELWEENVREMRKRGITVPPWEAPIEPAKPSRRRGRKAAGKEK